MPIPYIAGGNDRFFERDMNNRDSGNSGGGRGNDSRRGGGRSNKNRGNSDDPTESSQKSSRWGNVSPKSNVEGENRETSSAKKGVRKLANNSNRNNTSSNDSNIAEQSNEMQANATAAENVSNEMGEFLNDLTNPASTPVRPIRLLKDKSMTPTKSDEPNMERTESFSDSANVNSNAGTANKTQLNDTSKPPRRPKEANTTPLYDEPEEGQKSSHLTLFTSSESAPSSKRNEDGDRDASANGSRTNENSVSVSTPPLVASHQTSSIKEGNNDDETAKPSAE